MSSTVTSSNSSRDLYIFPRMVQNNAKPLLPLTKEDITGKEDDSVSQAGSYQPSTLSSFAERHHRRSRRMHQRDTFKTHFRIPRYLKRLGNYRSLDFESSTWEMLNLLIHPKQVYRALYYQRETHNKWSRDDPSFLLLLCGLVSITAIGWGLVYYRSFGGVVRLTLRMVFINFIFTGAVLATIGYFLTNLFLMDPVTTINKIDDGTLISKIQFKGSPLEWAYCFDVHCNSFVIIWVLLYLMQLVLLPLLRLDNIISLILGNTLYLVALADYLLITFYGYNTLPFLRNTDVILLPIALLLILWLFFTAFGFNFAHYMTEMYFN